MHRTQPLFSMAAFALPGWVCLFCQKTALLDVINDKHIHIASSTVKVLHFSVAANFFLSLLFCHVIAFPTCPTCGWQCNFYCNMKNNDDASNFEDTPFGIYRFTITCCFLNHLCLAVRMAFWNEILLLQIKICPKGLKELFEGDQTEINKLYNWFRICMYLSVPSVSIYSIFR